MLTTHFDESFGTADAYSVAGYVSSVEGWECWEREWLKMLKDFKVAALHKRELEHLWGDFKSWRGLPQEEQTKRKRDINKRACKVILKNVQAGFSASVVKSEWDTFDKGQWAARFGHSFYAAGALRCMTFVGVWASMFDIKEPIRYVFEKGAEGAGELQDMLGFFEKRDQLRELFRLHSWSFEPKKDIAQSKEVLHPGVLPLYAADFLAYETYRQMDNRVVGDKSRPMRKALKCLLQRTPSFTHLHDSKKPVPHFNEEFCGEHLRSLLAKMNSDPTSWGGIAATPGGI